MNLPQLSYKGRTILQSRAINKRWDEPSTSTYFLLPRVTLDGTAQPFIGPFESLFVTRAYIDDPARFSGLVGEPHHTGASHEPKPAGALSGRGRSAPPAGEFCGSARSVGAR